MRNVATSRITFHLLLGIFLPLSIAAAETFPLPDAGDTVVGAVQHVAARSSETLVDIAREFNLGYDQIIKANPDVNRWVPDEGAKVLIPHQYILPGEVRRGIVLNIPELRMYFYPGNGKTPADRVYTFPVSIGRMDWKTPLGATKVIRKDRDPAWHPTASIREEHARDGEVLPEVIPGGAPDNPLGRFALRLGFPGYLIHGVDERKTYGIGMKVTHGCIRMYPHDIQALFDMVPVSTPVHLLNQPIKVGWLGDKLFLEVHQPFDENEDENAPEEPRITLSEVSRYLRETVQEDIRFDEDLIEAITDTGDGIPREIARSSSRVAVRDISPYRVPEPSTPFIAPTSTPLPLPKSSLDQSYDDAMSQYLGTIEGRAAPTPTPIQVENRAPGTAQRRSDSKLTPQVGHSGSEVRRRIENRY